MKLRRSDSSLFFHPPYPVVQDRQNGWFFCTWAPEAEAVSVAGMFNHWQPDSHFLTRTVFGVWYGFIPEAQEGELYKYVLHWSDGTFTYQADPSASSMEALSGAAGRLCDLSDYPWQDAQWLAFRQEKTFAQRPLLLFHIDLTCWTGRESVLEKISCLIPRLKQFGYTGIAFSIGLGISTSFFAPCAGWIPHNLMTMVDWLHRAGMSVFLDWNPTICSTVFSALISPGQQPNQFGGTVFLDWNCPEVREFLCCSARFWMETYHLDGLRILAQEPVSFLAGKGSEAFFAMLSVDFAARFPDCQLFLCSPMPISGFQGQFERSIQPLADLFLQPSIQPVQSLAESGISPFFDMDTLTETAAQACYLAFLALPAGKMVLSGISSLSDSFLQAVHQCYLANPLLWPGVPFRWVAVSDRAMSLLAFWRGNMVMGQILCLCNPSRQIRFFELPDSNYQLQLLFSSDPCCSSFVVPEQSGLGRTISVPPITCLLFRYTPGDSM